MSETESKKKVNEKPNVKTETKKTAAKITGAASKSTKSSTAASSKKTTNTTKVANNKTEDKSQEVKKEAPSKTSSKQQTAKTNSTKTTNTKTSVKTSVKASESKVADAKTTQTKTSSAKAPTTKKQTTQTKSNANKTNSAVKKTNQPKKEETVKEKNTETKKAEKVEANVDEKNNKNEETKKELEDTVSLKEIRKALENKISQNQKHIIIKENIINIMVSIAIILYLIIVFLGSKNMPIETLETDLKLFSISFAIIGLIILEVAYTKDNSRIAFSGGEILIFGAINLCMIYVVKLYPANLLNVMTYISIAVAVYYLIKITILSIRSIKKYQKDNSDIKEIIKK